MKRALITNAYSADNKGDLAIVVSTAALLRDNGFSEIVVESDYCDSNRVLFEHFELESRPRRYSLKKGRLRVIRTIFSWAWRLLKVIFRRVNNQTYSGFDLIVGCGGGYMFSSKKIVSLGLISHCLNLMEPSLCGAQSKVVMAPQTFGPFTKSFDRWIVGKCINQISTVLYRDTYSGTSLEELSPNHDGLLFCPDVVFGLDVRTIAGPLNVREGGAKDYVCFTVIDWRWASYLDNETAETKYHQYVKGLTRLVSFIKKNTNYDVKIVIQVSAHGSNDKGTSLLLAQEAKKLGMDCDVVELERLDEIIKLYANAKCLIASRMHSAIFSLLVGTPVLGCSYQPKFRALFSDLGLESYCVDAHEFDSEKATAIFKKIIEDLSVSSEIFNTSTFKKKDRVVDIFGAVCS